MTKEEKIKSYIEEHYVIIFIILTLILSIFCFIKIWALPIVNYDEARHGVNAYEMIKRNNYIVNYFNENPDYWNLKPPLSYWIIILNYKIFGYNIFSLRLYSAVSYILTAIIVSLFVNKKFGKTSSIFSLVLFMSCYFLFLQHMVKTGDPDALFILIFSIAFISISLSDNNYYWLSLTGFCFALLFLTKSWHAIFLLPIVFFYLIFTGGFKKAKWYQIVLLFITAIIPILIWALLRYNQDGITFFKYMIDYDLLNRSTNAIEGHTWFPLYYLLIIGACAPILMGLVFCIIYYIVKFKIKQKFTNLDKLCIISFLCVFIMYSLAVTKLDWYIYPAFIPIIIEFSSVIFDLWRITDFKEKARTISKYFVLIITGLSIIATFVLSFNIRKTPDIQLFIKNMNLPSNSEIYYDIETKNDHDFQSELLLTEYYSDSYLKYATWEEFLKHKDSYFIIESKNLKEKETSSIVIILEKYNYTLCKNIGNETE